MLDKYEHVFLIPLNFIDIDFLQTVRTASRVNRRRFAFIISIYEKDSVNLSLGVMADEENVYVIKCEEKLSRTSHWEYIAKNASSILTFNTFSFYFSGDELSLPEFPKLYGKYDIYINDYFVNEWGNLKQNSKKHEVFSNDFKKIIKRNLLSGKPPLAPLQRIIFTRKVSEYLFFDYENAYISDQLMVTSLIKEGFTIKFIKKPFYKLNENKRSFYQSITFLEVLCQQINFYIQLKCYAGIPMVLLRSIYKKLILNK